MSTTYHIKTIRFNANIAGSDPNYTTPKDFLVDGLGHNILSFYQLLYGDVNESESIYNDIIYYSLTNLTKLLETEGTRYINTNPPVYQSIENEFLRLAPEILDVISLKLIFCYINSFNNWSEKGWVNEPTDIDADDTTFQNDLCDYFEYVKSKNASWFDSGNINLYYFKWNVPPSLVAPSYFPIFYDGNNPNADRTYTI